MDAYLVIRNEDASTTRLMSHDKGIALTHLWGVDALSGDVGGVWSVEMYAWADLVRTAAIKTM
jgi:hypothetical protein